MFSQQITGTLYDAEAPISGAKIMNVSSKSITSTDGRGNFTIYAQINDTLLFSSLFHHTKQVVVLKTHMEGDQVFELKKILNELDEVDIKGPIAEKKMDEKEETNRINKQFKTDVERNPHLYRRPNANAGPIDFLEIGRRIQKLFARKTPKDNQPEEVVETTVEASDLATLFEKDPFFNDNFLLLNLNITKDYKHLFFTYCETKNMSSLLLQSENSIYLIDKFLEYSEGFRVILAESQQR
ncbi:carboxypeptidase-like regulatory domain-containing protein [Gelidibacter salicanalis]|uniref:Carboxypeptidase-like regulatory domain-containing protein n=1 Tax=Gelidibacter salicanalis TaxID=291193 RepID=A0A5C7AGM6_9FLAO|nr:carboxypeptidase-like regulatory domain-containing protein [Gelidibacter salicanalis]TXE07698.1 carboxypeptidase-like regulatory domain-containing protein [Gelidibacter salicanalis]